MHDFVSFIRCSNTLFSHKNLEGENERLKGCREGQIAQRNFYSRGRDNVSLAVVEL
jgi:hypothetical protein